MTGPAEQQANTAVALSYSEGTAPVVTAKGSGEIAKAILQLAADHNIPIEQNPLLAAALSSVQLDDEIPEELYKAVSAVIAFILQNRPSASNTAPAKDDRQHAPEI
jgi:flagellar biosynthesis protein